jgi:predicted Ser/Thr protein kinase
MEHQHKSSDESSGDVDSYSQVQRLFIAAVQLPPEDRVSWVESQPDVHPQIVKQVVAALKADAMCGGDTDESVSDDPALAATIHGNECESKQGRSRTFPQIPNYEIIDEIDRGGMGVVYRARQHRPDRIVAIKMMKTGAFSSATDIERFFNEANAASSLDHAAVVPIYEAGEFLGEPFIVMKFIDGETFSRVLQRGEISTTDGIRKLCVVAQAIADAHEHGIIHRDLKPSNILIDRNTGTPWVTDFGLAKNLDADASLTSAGDIMGTPGYMAPEQAFGLSKTASRTADVYGLGAILYRILTGRPPIQSVDGDIAKTIELIREHDVVAPREANRRIPKDLNTVCVKSLETDPTLRYQNAGDFAEDLQRCLDGEAINARSRGLFRTIHQWARHRPGLAATLVTVGVFYIYHLIVDSAGLLPNDDFFKKAVSIIVPLTVFNAWFWQYWLRRTQGAAWTLYAWTTGEVALLTSLLMAGDGARSGLLPAYFVLVALSVLRCRPLLIGYVTALTVIGYGSLCVYTVCVTQEKVNPLLAIPTLLALCLVGVIQYIALSRSSVSLESQVSTSLDRSTSNL